MTKKLNRQTIIGITLLVVLILLTFIVAPNSNKLNSGSTYSVAPDGYGAWYNFMQQQGITIRRWQRPFKDIKNEKSPTTLLQVQPQSVDKAITKEQLEWVKAGNNLIILGVQEPTTKANFRSLVDSPQGQVKIETTRRLVEKGTSEFLLKDRDGAIVWQKSYAKGRVVYSSTAHIAANAYQDNRANYEYLSQLVGNKNNVLLVDEYIHGYKDPNIRAEEKEGDIFSYFIQKPIFVAAIQGVILLTVLIIAQNRRFGKAIKLESPKQDNSQAYIEALAAVLQKADTTDFVVEMVGREEQSQLQQALGLGKIGSLDRSTLAAEALLRVWQDKIGTSSSDLDSVLQVQSQKRRISEKDLVAWLAKWQTIRRAATNIRN